MSRYYSRPYSRRTRSTVLWGCISGILVALAVWFVGFPLVLWACWNAFIPAIFHGPTLTFWQAFGICGLLWLVVTVLRAVGGK